MFKKVSIIFAVAILVALPVLLSGCQVLRPKLGTAKNPIKLYFVPSVEVAVIVESGDAIAEFIKGQTGLEIEVKVPTTYAAVIEEMGAAEADAMAFIPAMGYVLAHDKYEMDAALATERYGWGFYWAQYIVARDSDIQTLADLNGKTWAYGSTTSTSGYLAPAVYFADHGIVPGEKVETGGHTQTVIAVYEGDADFGTTYYSAPGNTGDWDIGDPPEPAGEFTYTEKDGKVTAFKGGLQIRDARAAALSTYKDVVEKVRILDISDPVPNDTVSFCKDFPPEIRDQIVKGLIDYAATEEGQAVLANPEFYDITGFTPVDDAAFEPIRGMIKLMGLSEEDILK